MLKDQIALNSFSSAQSPRGYQLVLIALFAVALRLVVYACATHYGHITLDQYTRKADTESYIAIAGVMTGHGTLAGLDVYHLRVFPGYPVLIALVHLLGVSLPWAALLVTWISAAMAAVLAAQIFDDIRIGWAMTMLIPHYLINSSLGMSEAPLLAMVCAGVQLCKNNKVILAGIVFAIAGMIRPMGCFGFAGALFLFISERNWRKATLLCASAAITFATEAVSYQLWTGDALRGVHVYAQHPGAYDGHLFAWPFYSLFTTPAHDHATWGRIATIVVRYHLTFVLCESCI